MIIKDFLSQDFKASKLKKEAQNTLQNVVESANDISKNIKLIDHKNAKNFYDFVLTSEVFFNLEEYIKEEVSSINEDFLKCANHSAFYTYRFMNAVDYKKETRETEDNLLQKIAFAKQKIQDRKELLTYYVTELEFQIIVLSNCLNNYNIEEAKKALENEWLNQEYNQGLFLLQDMIENKKLKTLISQTVEYIEKLLSGESVELKFLIELLKEVKNSIEMYETPLNKMEKRIKDINTSNIYDLKMPIIPNVSNGTYYLEMLNGKVIFYYNKAITLYKKTETNSDKILKIFLFNYAKYLYSYCTPSEETGNKLVKEWPAFYEEIVKDNDLSTVLALERSGRMSKTDILNKSEAYAEVFTVCHFNNYKKQNNIFYKVNKDKTFIHKLLSYLYCRV